MNARHDALVDALSAMLGRLERAEAVEAGEAVEALVGLVHGTTAPLADARVRPLFERCVQVATALQARLAEEVRHAGTSERAAAAYGDER